MVKQNNQNNGNSRSDLSNNASDVLDRLYAEQSRRAILRSEEATQ